MSTVRIGNRPRFFTDHDDDSIGQFADADSGPVTRSQFRRKGAVTGQGQQTAGSHDAVIADNDGAIVERRIGNENIAQ